VRATGRDARHLPPERFVKALKNRLLQALARVLPGGRRLRGVLHRWRGVKVGEDTVIAQDVVIETAYPEWVSIGNGVQLGFGTIILAHIHGLPPKASELGGYVSVRIEDEANIGPRVTILPNVTIGRGAVVTAGSVVSQSVPPLTVVQGNPARPIARSTIPLTWDTPYKLFLSRLMPLDRKRSRPTQ
jgi:acetyltransferase-like isoleucine patch superfamily enzyme